MLAITLILLPLIAFAASVKAEGSFITPPATGLVHDYSANPLYHVGDTLDIQWDVSWQNISLWLWQNDNPNAENLLSSVKNTGKLSWQIRTNKDPASLSVQSGTNGTVFFLQVVGMGVQKGQFGSHYFNLSEPTTTSTSSPSSTPAVANLVASGGSSTTADATPTPDTTTVQVTPTASPTAATTTNSQSSSADAANQSASSTPAASPAPASNTGLAAGLGVAFGLVFAGLVAAVVYILLKRRRKNNALAQQHEETAGWSVSPGPSMTKSPAAPPIYQGADGYYGKAPLPSAATEIIGRGQTPPYSAGYAGRVHEMPGTEHMTRNQSVRQISGTYEMPVHTRGNSNGIFNEEG